MGGLHLGLSNQLSLSGKSGGGGGGSAPILTSATVVVTSATTATIGVTTDQSTGTLYYVVSTSGTPPSAAQVKAGQDSGGGAATYSGNQAIASSGAKTANATGLTQNTAYFAYFMHENIGGSQSNVAASSTFTTWYTETSAWVTAVVGDGGTVSTPRGQLVNNLVDSLKTAGVWTKLDRMWLFAAENTQSALRDIKAAAAATVTVSPTFTTDRGYTGNGTTQFINSGFTPSTAGGNFTQNSCHISARARNNVQTNAIIGPNVSAAVARVTLTLRNTSDLVRGILNGDPSIVDVSAASTDSTGFWTYNRSAAGATQVYRNGSSFTTGTQASTGNQSVAIAFLRDANTAVFSTYQIASGTIGGSLSSGEISSLNSAELTYMQAVGAA